MSNIPPLPLPPFDREVLLLGRPSPAFRPAMGVSDPYRLAWTNPLSISSVQQHYPPLALNPGSPAPLPAVQPMSAQAASVYTMPPPVNLAPPAAPSSFGGVPGPGPQGGPSFAGTATYNRPPPTNIPPAAGRGPGGVPARLGLPPAATAAGAVEGAGAATAAQASGSMLSRLGGVFQRGAASMAGRPMWQRAGIGILPSIAAGFIPDSPGRLDDVARGALSGAGIGGSIASWPGAIAGGIGGGVIGWLTGDDGDDGGSVQDKVNDRFTRILTQYGADSEFIRQAQNQFRLAWEVAGGDDGLPRDQVETLANDVLNGMIQQWQITQGGGPTDPFQAARDQLAEAREYDLAQIAAAQAWMQPLVTDITQQQQQYADLAAQSGLSMAEGISDPAVSAAFETMMRQMSSDAATQNAIMVQQMAYQPQQLQAQLDQQYETILNDLAMQEAQYNAEVLAAGGTLPGQTPIVGGIPLAPLGAAPPQPAPIPEDYGGIVAPSTDSTRVIRAAPYDPLSSGVPGSLPPQPPPTGTTTTTAPVVSQSTPPIAAGTVPPTAFNLTPGEIAEIFPNGTGPIPTPSTAPNAAPPSDQAGVDTQRALTQWMGDLVASGATRDGAIAYAAANGYDPTMAAMAFDAASAQNRSVPTTGTTIPGFAGQGRAPVPTLNEGGAGGAPPPLGPALPGDTIHDILTNVVSGNVTPGQPSSGAGDPRQAAVEALMALGLSDVEALALVRNPQRYLRNHPQQAGGPLHSFPNPGSLTGVLPGTVPPTPPTIYDNYGMFPPQLNDLINRTQLIPS